LALVNITIPGTNQHNQSWCNRVARAAWQKTNWKILLPDCICMTKICADSYNEQAFWAFNAMMTKSRAESQWTTYEMSWNCCD